MSHEAIAALLEKHRLEAVVMPKLLWGKVDVDVYGASDFIAMLEESLVEE